MDCIIIVVLFWRILQNVSSLEAVPCKDGRKFEYTAVSFGHNNYAGGV